MGTFSVPIQVAASRTSRYVSLYSLVDTGATYSVFPGNVLSELGVVAEETRTFELADGSETEFQSGEASIRVEGKRVTAVVVFWAGGDFSAVGGHHLGIGKLGRGSNSSDPSPRERSIEKWVPRLTV